MSKTILFLLGFFVLCAVVAAVWVLGFSETEPETVPMGPGMPVSRLDPAFQPYLQKRIDMISADPDWMLHVNEQAAKANRTVEAQLPVEAMWWMENEEDWDIIDYP